MKYLLLFVSLIGLYSPLGAQTKYVVLEEHTGFWCQWCPRGNVESHRLQNEYETLIPIEIHSNDAVEYGDYLAKTGLTGAPSGNIDRVGIDLQTSTWESNIKSQLAKSAIASIEVSTDFDENTREFTVEVSANFTTAPTSEMRLAAIILENGVTGPAPGYNQSNAYSNGRNGEMGGFEKLASSINANSIGYNHISRQLLGGYEGEENSLPSTINLNEDYSYTFKYIIPDEWNPDYLYAAGLLINSSSGTIENAGKSTFLDGTSNSAPKFSSKPVSTGYEGIEYKYDLYGVDADDHGLEITLLEGPAWLTLGATSDLGNIHTKATLSGTPMAKGSYEVTVAVSDGDKTSEQTFTIEVVDAPDNNWVLAGSQGFSEGNSSIYDLVIGKNNTLYAAVNENNEILDVYAKKPGKDWVKTNLFASGGRYAQMAMGSDDKPWIVFSTSTGTYVRKYTGSGWEAVGPTGPSGVQIGFDLDENDVPAFCMQDGSSGYDGNAYRLENDQWVKMGGTKYSNAEGVWNDCQYGTDGKLYVLWTDFAGGRKSYVSVFDGTSWSQLGGGPINDEATYFYQKLAINDRGELFVAIVQDFEAQNLNVYQYDGKWLLIGEDLIGDHTCQSVDLAFDENGNPTVAFVDETEGDAISCMTYDGSEWTYVGVPNFSGASAAYPNLVYNDNIPYVGFRDFTQSDAITVRSYGDDPTYLPPVNRNLQVHIYPNPASGYLNVDLESEMSLEIYTMSGQLVLRRKKLMSSQIDMSSLPAGMYMLRLRGSSETYTEHIVLE